MTENVLMKRRTAVIVMILGAIGYLSSYPGLAQNSLGGPTKQGSVGGPMKQSSPVVPASKSGLTSVPPLSVKCPAGTCRKFDGNPQPPPIAATIQRPISPEARKSSATR
jgi:hypothetical protein